MNKKEYSKQFIFEAVEDIKKGDDIIVEVNFEEFGDSSGGIIYLEELEEIFNEHFGKDKSVHLSVNLSSTKDIGGDRQAIS